MKRIILPDNPDTLLPFYLAAEEWVARNLPADEYFFAWQVRPTVICGRHQQIEVEVELSEAKRRGINVCRRKSGGGAVYADLNNVMFSYITPSGHVQTTFGSYTAMVCRMLGSLGIEAEPTGRNDIAIGGSKVAGNAFYKLPGRSIVHGTMLYDADFATMAKVLTPSRAKRESKGVVSVPSRVTTLRAQGLKMTCKEFVRHACEFIGADGDIVLTPDQLAEVAEIEQSYYRPDFLRIEPTGAGRIVKSAYINGVGEVKFSYRLDADGLITEPDLRGDFFQLQPVEDTLLQRLQGVALKPDAIAKALEGIGVGRAIMGLDEQQFINLITN